MLFAASAEAAEAPFSIHRVESVDRTVQADIADLDGDGREDLLCIAIEGLPPDERRKIVAYYQRPDGTLADAPDWRGPLPDGVAAYDLANLDADAAVELILLRQEGLTLFSLADRQPRSRNLAVPEIPTIAAIHDERGVDRLRIARTGLAEEPRLLVPGLGELTVLTPSGEILGRLEIGARANYFLPPRPGPVIAESEIEIYFDHPRVGVGDVDGDGRGDILGTNRHEMRVFLQNEDGTWPSAPSRSHAFRLLTPTDHIRSAGSVRVESGDFDGDGRLDLLISNSSGSFFDATTDVTIHMNRSGHWDFDAPDQLFHTEGGITTNQALDLDGDGRMELIAARIPMGILEFVEILLTRAIDAELAIHRSDGDRPFDPKPWNTWKMDIAFSFDTFRTRGFIPTLEADFNGDGWRDLIGSGDGDEIAIHLGEVKRGYKKRHARQKLDTGGRIRFGDLNGDGLTDFVLYDPRRPTEPLRVGINRGVLPGTVRRESPGAKTER
jgi:hypothetical protein